MRPTTLKLASSTVYPSRDARSADIRNPRSGDSRASASFFCRFLVFSLLVGSFAALGSPAQAQTTYSFLGQPFTVAPPPYASGDRVEGFFTLPLPLRPFLNLEEVSGHLIDFSFVDGVQSRSPINTTVCTFQVSTDAAGDITDWLISLRQAPTPNPSNPQQLLDSSSGGDQVGEGPAGTTACGVVVPTIVASNSTGGQWTTGPVPGTDFTYQYLGSPFTAVMAPYSTNDRVSGSIALGSSLPPFLPLTEIGLFLKDFSFEDGVQTRIPTNTFPCVFEVATDGTGSITQWRFSLRQTPLPAPGSQQRFLDSSVVGDSVGSALVGIDVCDTLANGTGATSDTPGSWDSALPKGSPTTYEYTGEPFSAADAPWSVGESVLGTILLSDVLPPNLPLTEISSGLIEFTFQDGVQVRELSNSSVCRLQVATNGSGGITDWLISLRQAPLPPQGQPQRFLDSSGLNDTVGEGPAGTFACETIVPTISAASALPGTWTGQRGPVVEVPTLSSMGLGFLCLALLFAASRVLRRRSEAP
ncbi:MAG: hypothetical protein K0U98_00250 [Deltaproteobacteria bacterium]|nr:hypothetical protein [Deltaproteobacteria bacterium]